VTNLQQGKLGLVIGVIGPMIPRQLQQPPGRGPLGKVIDQPVPYIDGLVVLFLVPVTSSNSLKPFRTG
jgi:hypothetical protein